MLFQSEAKLVDELRASLEKQHAEQLEKAQDQLKKEEIQRINDELLKQKQQLLKVVTIFQLYSFRRRFLWHYKGTSGKC